MAVKAAIFCFMLLGGLAPALALTLGSLQGQVWIGRSMDVALALYAEPDEDLAALCLQADVFYADTRQDPRGVALSFKAGLPGQPAMLRVASAALVDEPMVTLHLRAGCVHKTSRRYVLLADPPVDLSAPAPVPAPAPAPPLAARPPVTPAEPAAFASASEPSPSTAPAIAAPTTAALAGAAPVKLAEPVKAAKRAKAVKKAKAAKSAKPAKVREAGKGAKVDQPAPAKP